jgi:hypothetical protein
VAASSPKGLGMTDAGKTIPKLVLKVMDELEAATIILYILSILQSILDF